MSRPIRTRKEEFCIYIFEEGWKDAFRRRNVSGIVGIFSLLLTFALSFLFNVPCFVDFRPFFLMCAVLLYLYVFEFCCRSSFSSSFLFLEACPSFPCLHLGNKCRGSTRESPLWSSSWFMECTWGSIHYCCISKSNSHSPRCWWTISNAVDGWKRLPSRTLVGHKKEKGVFWIILEFGISLFLTFLFFLFVREMWRNVYTQAGNVELRSVFLINIFLLLFLWCVWFLASIFVFTVSVPDRSTSTSAALISVKTFPRRILVCRIGRLLAFGMTFLYRSFLLRTWWPCLLFQLKGVSFASFFSLSLSFYEREITFFSVEICFHWILRCTFYCFYGPMSFHVDFVARSVMISTLHGQDYVFCGLADGHLSVFFVQNVRFFYVDI